jgi:hypothetical protein
MGKMGLKMNLTCPVRQIKLLLLSHGSPEVAYQVDRHDNAKHWWPASAFGFIWSLIMNYFNILTSIPSSVLLLYPLITMELKECVVNEFYLYFITVNRKHWN